jgi:hypothetical protein
MRAWRAAYIEKYRVHRVHRRSGPHGMHAVFSTVRPTQACLCSYWNNKFVFEQAHRNASGCARFA